MFEPDYIKTFMGGDFTLDNTKYTAHNLAIEFRKWANELDGWGLDVNIAEVAIVKDRIQVTLEEGLPE